MVNVDQKQPLKESLNCVLIVIQIRLLKISNGLGKKTLQKQFDKLILPVFKTKPRTIILMLDATYFGKKKNKDGLLIGKDWLTKDIV